MHHVAGAEYLSGDRQECLRGTGKDVLRQIERWLGDEKDRRVFWLNGLAGTGKSTIAQTVAKNSFADRKLGASFFCSKDFEDRRDVHKIFPTLAFQLACRFPEFRKELLPVLRTNPEIGQESLCSQLEKLIIGPFKATPIRTLIVIDALDKCEDEEPASATLSVLSRYVDQLPRVKFFITGCPEPRIHTGFRLEPLRPIAEVLKFYDVERSSVDADIRLFLETQLTETAKSRSDCNFGASWPSSCDIDILCKKSDGFFIYASTIVKFIASKDGLPTERLNLITSLPQCTGRDGEPGIDYLYTQVLEEMLRRTGADTSFLARFIQVVGSALLVFNPISREALAELLEFCDRPSRISNTLRHLHSLLLVPSNEVDPIRAFHESFPDFLTDRKRCSDERFFIEPSVHHTRILLSCLRLMKKKSKKNICDLNGCPLLSDIKNLPNRRKVCIGDALEYACRFWTKHLSEIPTHGPHVEQVKKDIEEFFTKHLLFWIEALSLTGQLNLGIYALHDIDQWYTSVSCVGYLPKHAFTYAQMGSSCEWTNDSQHLIMSNFDRLRDSPIDIYRHVLPFCPSSSWLRKWYTSESLREVKVIKGCPEKWGTCTREVPFPHHPEVLAHQKYAVAVGLSSGDIIILDAVTGSRRSVLYGHNGSVVSLAFSPDGALLVSGCVDNNIDLWDVQTGGVVKSFHDLAFFVSISPDSLTIASGSPSGIRLWDVRTGKSSRSIETLSGPVTCLTFLPTTPGRLMFASSGLLQQCDIGTGDLGPTTPGHHVAFSSDGKRFVLCGDGLPTIRDTVSGEVVATLDSPGGNLNRCCFSPGDKFVAGADPATVYVWNVTGTPQLIETFAPLGGGIFLLVYSVSLVSMHIDGRVRFQRIGGNPPESTSKNPGRPRAKIVYITLQAEEGFAISVNSAGAVMRWDLSTDLPGSLLQTPVMEDVVSACLVEDTLIVVHCPDSGWHVSRWDIKETKPLETIPLSGDLDPIACRDVGISKDGTTFFVVDPMNIRTWSLLTGEITGSVSHTHLTCASFSATLDDSIIWVRSLARREAWGWDSRNLESPPLDSSKIPDRSRLVCLQDVDGAWGNTGKTRIIDVVSQTEVFRLPGKFAHPDKVAWDGRYLFAVYGTGEPLIVEFVHADFL